jgi:cell division protein FtsI/penicillin-binding protein 2
MLRRQSLSIILGGLAGRADGARKLDRFFDSGSGYAMLLDVPGRRVVARTVTVNRPAPPGSTLKPFVLSALLKLGRLRTGESYVCPGRLRIGRRTFDCSHPEIITPMQIETALAYSCNCFVAHLAERFAPGELGPLLAEAGFSTARNQRAAEAQRLQALGEDGTMVTAEEMVHAYANLATGVAKPIHTGLEGAAEYGTGQRAQQSDVKVAGKTGSSRTVKGDFVAWFAGFMPSGAPEVAIAVMLRGRSGGADAAPVAGRILEAYRAGRL